MLVELCDSARDLFVLAVVIFSERIDFVYLKVFVELVFILLIRQHLKVSIRQSLGVLWSVAGIETYQGVSFR